MWLRAKVPVKAEYGETQITIGAGEVFYKTRYSPYVAAVDPVKPTEPTPEEVSGFVERIIKRLDINHIFRKLNNFDKKIQVVKDIESELIQRRVRATKGVIAQEMGICRERVGILLKME